MSQHRRCHCVRRHDDRLKLLLATALHVGTAEKDLTDVERAVVQWFRRTLRELEGLLTSGTGQATSAKRRKKVAEKVLERVNEEREPVRGASRRE